MTWLTSLWHYSYANRNKKETLNLYSFTTNCLAAPLELGQIYNLFYASVGWYARHYLVRFFQSFEHSLSYFCTLNCTCTTLLHARQRIALGHILNFVSVCCVRIFQSFFSLNFLSFSLSFSFISNFKYHNFPYSLEGKP